jgi:hypothetical protein
MMLAEAGDDACNPTQDAATIVATTWRFWMYLMN